MEEAVQKFKIADVIISIKGDQRFVNPQFALFAYHGTDKEQIQWTYSVQNPPLPSGLHNWKDMGGFEILRLDNKVYVRYLIREYHIVRAVIYENDYQKVTFYLPKEELFASTEQYLGVLHTSLFAFEREAFFFGMLKHNGLSLHSASIIYNDCGIAFSAPSGTGKSTHTNMWKEYYQTPILDGDVAMCRVLDNRLLLYGLPWSGSSNLFLNQAVEWKVVVFLEQSKENKIKMLNKGDLIKGLYTRTFTSVWFKEIHLQVTKISEKICDLGLIGYHLCCRPDRKAVDLVRSTIDELFIK